MKAAKKDPGTQNQKITSFLLSYRTTPHTTTGCTPAELLMNRRLRTSLDLLRPDLRKKVGKGLVNKYRGGGGGGAGGGRSIQGNQWLKNK